MAMKTFERLTGVHVLASCAVSLTLLVAATQAGAGELRVLSAAAMQSVFKEVAGEFERMSGHKLIIEYGTIGGIAQRVQSGEAPDFVIGSSLSMPPLVKDGKIQAASQVTICKTAIGMVVRAGAVKPSLQSVEDFKRALVAAHTIVYADPARGGAAGVHIEHRFANTRIQSSVVARRRGVNPDQSLSASGRCFLGGRGEDGQALSLTRIPK